MLIWLNNKYYKVLMLSCTEVTVMLVWLYKFYPVFFKMLSWLCSRKEYLVIIILVYCIVVLLVLLRLPCLFGYINGTTV